MAPRSGIVLCLLVSLTALQAANVFYCFDEDAEMAADAGKDRIDLPFLGGSGLTKDAAKFGPGSLALGAEALMGVGDFLRAESSSSELAREISKMTISVWVMARAEDAGDKEIFILQRLNGSEGMGGFTFLYAPTGTGEGRLSFFTTRSDGQGGISRVYSEEKVHFAPGEWTHVAMTLENGQVAFYLNGQALGSPQALPDAATVIPDITDSNVGVFRLMVSSPSIQYADDFAFFGDTALDADGIQRLYERGLQEFTKAGQ